MNKNKPRPFYYKDRLYSEKERGKPRIGILSLGCPRNLTDSESILGRLNLKGYPIVDIQEADIAMINTCGFIKDAKVESIDAILDLINLKKEGKLKNIIVYGCLVQRYKETLRKELPEVDAFVGKISLNHQAEEFSLTPQHYKYLKVCEGCINNCSYCIIPQIKGKFTSLDTESILKKAKRFDAEKVGELNIIGQDITGYGLDLYQQPRLVPLLKKVIKEIKNIRWIRLLYLYPSRVNDELLELIAHEPRLCKYVDLPIQHINNRILKLMHRKTTESSILKLIDKIRKKIPDVAIRTSLIVGFPSETNKEFEELVKFVEDTRFERLGGFIYSREEQTKAFDFAKQVPDKIKQARFDILMSIQQKIAQEVNQRFFGRVLEVLIDEKDSSSGASDGFYPVRKDTSQDANFSHGVYLGRSQYDAPEVDGLVYVNSKKELRPGDFVRVKITDTLEYDLVGRLEK